MNAYAVTVGIIAVITAAIVGTVLYVLLAHHSITRAEHDGYRRGFAEGQQASRETAAAGEYSRGVAAGRRLTEIEHGWGPAVNAPDVPADRLERSPDFNWVIREPVQRMPRPVFDY